MHFGREFASLKKAEITLLSFPFIATVDQHWVAFLSYKRPSSIVGHTQPSFLAQQVVLRVT